MSGTGSILPPLVNESEEYSKPLKTRVDQLDLFFRVLPTMSKGYTKKEKTRWWTEQKGRRFKIGLIRSHDLNTEFTVINETFNVAKVVKKNVNIKQIPTESEKKEIIKAVKQSGFDTQYNKKDEIIDIKPEKYFTAKDFDRLYLGWIEDKKTTLPEKDQKVIKATMKQLFRFVFGTKEIHDVNDFHTRLIISYTPLTPTDKIPCDSESPVQRRLREDFRACLQYRLDMVRKEVIAGSTALGEQTQYVEQKKELLLGLRDIINSLDTKAAECMIYGEDDSMVPDKKTSTSLDGDYDRLLRIYVALLEDRQKQNPSFPDYKTFQNYLVKGQLQSSLKGKELYQELLTMLDRATMKHAEELEQEIKRLSELIIIANKQHEAHVELEKLRHKGASEQSTKDLEVELAELKKAAKEVVIPPENTSEMANLLRQLAALLGADKTDPAALKQLLNQLSELTGKSVQTNSAANANTLRYLKEQIETLKKYIKDNKIDLGLPDEDDEEFNSIGNLLKRVKKILIGDPVQGDSLTDLLNDIDENLGELNEEDCEEIRRELEAIRLALAAQGEGDEPLLRKIEGLIARASASASAAPAPAPISDAELAQLRGDIARLTRELEEARAAAAAAPAPAPAPGGQGAAAAAAAPEEDERIAQLAAQVAALELQLAAAELAEGNAQGALAAAEQARRVAVAAAEAATARVRELEAAQQAAAAAAAAAAEASQQERAAAAARLAEVNGQLQAAQAAQQAATQAVAQAAAAAGAREAELNRQLAEAREAAVAAVAQRQAEIDRLVARIAELENQQPQVAAAPAAAPAPEPDPELARLREQLAEAQRALQQANLQRGQIEAQAREAARVAAATEAGLRQQIAQQAAAAQAAALAAQQAMDRAVTEAREQEQEAARAAAAQAADQAAAAAATAAAEIANLRTQLDARIAELRIESAIATAAQEEITRLRALLATAEQAQEEDAAEIEGLRRQINAQVILLYQLLGLEQGQDFPPEYLLERAAFLQQQADEIARLTGELAEKDAAIAELRTQLAEVRQRLARTEAAAATSQEESQTLIGQLRARIAKLERDLAGLLGEAGAAAGAAGAAAGGGGGGGRPPPLPPVRPNPAGLGGFGGPGAASAAAPPPEPAGPPGPPAEPAGPPAAEAAQPQLSPEEQADLDRFFATFPGFRWPTQELIDWFLAQPIYKGLTQNKETLINAVCKKLNIPRFKRAIFNRDDTLELISYLLGIFIKTRQLKPIGDTKLVIFQKIFDQYDTSLKTIPENVFNLFQRFEGANVSQILGSSPIRPASAASSESRGFASAGSFQTGQAGQQTFFGSAPRPTTGPSAAPPQGGGGSLRSSPLLSKTSYCETMLTLLLLHAQEKMKEKSMFVLQDFLDKGAATLDDLGQCPIVLHTLNKLLDDSLQNINRNFKPNEKGISYSVLKESPQDELSAIERAYNNRFSEEEQEALESLTPTVLFSRPPEVYQDILGKQPYLLTIKTTQDESHDEEETPLYGFDEDPEDPIYMNKEESDSLTTGGISLGGLLFLYLNCLRQIEMGGNTPSLNSKCLLPEPKRSREMGKTPRAKSPRKRSSKPKQVSKGK